MRHNPVLLHIQLHMDGIYDTANTCTWHHSGCVAPMHDQCVCAVYFGPPCGASNAWKLALERQRVADTIKADEAVPHCKTALTLNTCPARLVFGGLHHVDGRWWALHLSQAYPPSCRLKLLTANDIAAHAGRLQQKLCLIYLACWIGVLDGARWKATWPGCLHADHDFDLKRGGGPRAVPTGRASLDVRIPPTFAPFISSCLCACDTATSASMHSSELLGNGRQPEDASVCWRTFDG